ncbi:hypothetical protein PV05_10567 [Exophiala xenobiotica]|uniref:Uncharacterized protein n=1 Tax=Exophiala xenobiotica TaxID=348802 RepID=A0A0D2CPK3_9EURO|nr:uncharacterized protein PV05_10567 [Exophiala xenobiotica]KIW51892.1 hypothetical protein PV05_10567 [Exophiala xenobiotica]
MPQAHGFNVTLVSVDNEDYVEYGNQTVGGSASRSRVVSSKVLARDGERFYVKIRYASVYAPRYELRSNFNNSSIGGPNGNVAKENQRANSNELPYKFALKVYVNGEEEQECSRILSPDLQEVVMKGRYKILSKGTGQRAIDVSVQPWIFTDRGIETLLSRLDLSPDSHIPESPIDREVDEIADALENLTPAKRSRPGGQVEVKIYRLIDLGVGIYEGGYRRNKDQDTEDRNADGTLAITTDRKSQSFKRLHMHSYEPYDDKEEFYAKFVLQAMDLPKLINLGLCTPDGKPTQQRLQAQMPLAIMPSSSTCQSSPMKRVKTSSHGSDSEDGDDKMDDSSDSDSSADEGTSSDDDAHRPHKRRGAIMHSETMQAKATPGTARKIGWKPEKPSLTYDGEVNESKEKWLQIVRANGEDGFQMVKANTGDTEASYEPGQLLLGDANGNETGDGKETLELVKVDHSTVEDMGEDKVEW